MAGTSPAMTINGDAVEKRLLALRLLRRHAFEAVLHLFHLTAQIVDVAFRGLRRSLRFSRALWHERLEHRERLLKQFHVAADMLLKRRKRRSAVRVGHLLAAFFLFA